MTRKLQQYYILKFNSSRLKKAHYNIVGLTLDQARKNGEVVSMGDSQLLRSLRFLKGIDDQDIYQTLRSLSYQRKRAKSHPSDNIPALPDIDKNFDALLFVPEIISIVVEHNSHYVSLLENGVWVNGKRYVRFQCGAGNARRNTVIFIDESYKKQTSSLLSNNHNPTIQIAPAKYNAYFALGSSATHSVSNLNFVVIPDCIVQREETVEFVEESTESGKDDIILEKDMLLDFNLFDGMGVISPASARRWSDELELDYTPSTFIVRNSFLKGMVCVFDFHRFADLNGVMEIKDVWGTVHNAYELDMILTESQFKLWNGYQSHTDYTSSCEQNHMHWGVSRVSPKRDQSHVFSNYQFLQVLDLNKSQIKSLCKKTIDYFKDIISGDIRKTLLYLLGKNTMEYNPDLLDHVGDSIAKSLVLNNELLDDDYIQSHLANSLNRRIRESYIGNLILDGNYSTMIADPYALVEHAFGLPANGLLKRGENYSNYWSKKGIRQVVACRAPLTWRSEVNILNLQNSRQQQDWYKYIEGGIIYNVHGADMILHADSDMDGDIVMTTSCPEFISGAQGGLPITYSSQKVPKQTINDRDLGLADLAAFNSKIGFITNCSTTMYAMLALYRKSSRQHSELIKRLKICRKEQGSQIDKAKGLIVRPFPIHWTRWSKDSKLNNSIIIDRRPYFMRYLYPNYNRKYLKFWQNYETFCISKFGKSIDDLLNSENLTEHEQEIKQKYFRFQPLIDSDCIMNNICHTMEAGIKEIKHTSKHASSAEKVIMILKDKDIPFDKDKFQALHAVFKKYKAGRRNFANMKDASGETKFHTLDQYSKSIRQEAYQISSNICELANLAVSICYEAHPSESKSFVWGVFGDGIVKNVTKNRQKSCAVPFLVQNDEDFDFETLGLHYKMMEIDVKEEIDTEGDENDYI